MTGKLNSSLGARGCRAIVIAGVFLLAASTPRASNSPEEPVKRTFERR
jgi:hypothetical protein